MFLEVLSTRYQQDYFTEQILQSNPIHQQMKKTIVVERGYSCPGASSSWRLFPSLFPWVRSEKLVSIVVMNPVLPLFIYSYLVLLPSIPLPGYLSWECPLRNLLHCYMESPTGDSWRQERRKQMLKWDLGARSPAAWLAMRTPSPARDAAQGQDSTAITEVFTDDDLGGTRARVLGIEKYEEVVIIKTIVLDGYC